MKIRILHITQALGGVESYLNQIIQHMDRERFEILLMFPKSDGPLAVTAKKLGVEQINVDLVRDINPLKDVAGLVRMSRHVRRIRPELIHVHSSKAGVLGRLTAGLFGIPCIYTPNAYAYLGAQGLRKKFYLRVERILRPFTAKLLAVGRSEANRSTEDVGFTPEKVTFVNNAIVPLTVTWSPTSNSEKKPLVLMVGRLNHQKNPEMFVLAAGRVARRKPEARFMIVGGGYHEFHGDMVRDLIASLGLQEQFQIHEWMAQEDLHHVMAQADIIVVPSRYDGLPFIPLEAMSMGKPVVGTQVDGVQDVIVDGITGYLVELDDITAMADRIVYLLKDSQLRINMGREGRKRIEKEFNISTNIRQIEDVYAEVCQQTQVDG